jgi:hypothetical protein
MNTEPTDDDVTRVDRRHDATTEFVYQAYGEAHDVELPYGASTRRRAAITARITLAAGAFADGVVFEDTAMTARAQCPMGRSDKACLTAREQIEKAAAEHGWEATIQSRWANEYRKGEDLMLVYFRPEGDVTDATYFRGDIGLSFLAPTSGIADCAVGWLAEPLMSAADPTPLITITPGERDAAATAVRGMSATLLMGMVVDAVVAAINEHRDKSNGLLT